MPRALCQCDSGAVCFSLRQGPKGVWIARRGQVELAAVSDRRRTVGDVLRGGDADGRTARVSAEQARLIAILGRPLPAQVAQLLLDESTDGTVQLAQRTLSAMLGVPRPCLNRILKEFERDGLIAAGYAEISIVDVNGLGARAGSRAGGLSGRAAGPTGAAVAVVRRRQTPAARTG
ncbi:helix-turn-helix domain-containing protein [Mycolicibacterium austroafricanum]|nr:helix-turn-helix domain-containing protein [Mycolicibacterium austroafricanum]